MSPKIYNIKEPLDLSRLRLTKPINKNGSHFIKTLDIEDPIYFLGPKCLTKQGFVKSGKKVFCDFIFSNEDSEFLAWLENLEESARRCIYENGGKWFETPLDEHDIENSMSSPYRSYKSGKYFIVRANVPTALDKINIKVYDENEQETSPDNIKETTKVLAVLEFQGIRCSVRSFQFEIELKQLLIVEPEKLFESCIIRKTTNSGSHKRADEEDTISKMEGEEEDNTRLVMIKKDEPKEEEPPISVSAQEPEQPILEQITEIHLEEPNQIAVEIVEGDFPLDITDSNSEKEPPLRLKSRNDVYYKQYKEMRQRAKEAKREALANYLEAKRIKNTYLLEDLSDSESDEEELNLG
jgi:hypothetical protein